MSIFFAKNSDHSNEILARKYSHKFLKQVHIDTKNDCFRQRYDTQPPQGRGRPPKKGGKSKKK